MKEFSLDDEIINERCKLGYEKINNLVLNLRSANNIVLTALDEIRSHDELDSNIYYNSLDDEIKKLEELSSDYNTFKYVSSAYSNCVDDKFYSAQEKVLEELSSIRSEDITIKNNVGITEAKVVQVSGVSHYTAKYEQVQVEKKVIGFEDILTYGKFNDIMKLQYDQLKEQALESGEEYTGTINDYIKEIVTAGEITYEVGWKKWVSLGIDVIPIVGDAKGIIECVVGKDLITGRELSTLERGLCLASIIPFYGDGVKIGSEFLQTGYKSAGKIFLKELTTNAVNMGVSVSAQEVGVNPLLALLMYQTGRIGYKNLSRNGLSIDYVLHQSKVYDNQLGTIYKDSTLEALIDLKTINNTLDSNKEIKNAFKVIKENKECKEILFKNLESIDKSSVEEIEKALKNTLDEVKNTNKDVYETLIKNSSLSSIFKGVSNPELNRLDYLRNKYGKLTSEQVNNRINLRGAVNNEIDRLYKSGLTKNEIGPAVAGVLDPKTGKYYFGINNIEGDVPEVLHPLIKERIDNMPLETYNSYEKWTLGAGSHAEVYALNEAMLANPNAKLEDFMVYVVRSGKKLKPRGLPMPRCPHCEYITDGASYFPEVLRYGK